MLGNPEYIQILVDPGNRRMAIRKYHKYMKDVLKVEYDSEGDFEYYSDPLLGKLAYLIKDVNKSRTYRIVGKAYRDEVITFDMEKALPLEFSDNEERDKAYGNKRYESVQD